MNIGQLLETMLGWAAHYLHYNAATPVFDGPSEAEVVEQVRLAKEKILDDKGLTGKAREEYAANFQLDNYGASLTAELLLNRLWGERQPFRRLQVGYAYIYQHRRDNEPYFKSNYAMEYLRHKFTASLSHRIWDRLGRVRAPEALAL